MLTYKIERDNYKQALEDIREIVSAEIDRTDADDELMQIYGSIYNKINEVINNAN
jgi:short-subunit dehydrogenase involved in D-alanine esterification of teichoic acids